MKLACSPVRLGGVLVAAALALACEAPKAPEGTARAQYLFQNCTACHGDRGQGIQQFGAPTIAGLPAWYVEAQLKKFRDGSRGGHVDDVEGLRMRPMARTLPRDTDLPLVAAYVEALGGRSYVKRAPIGDAAAGQALYATCAACHGPKATGNPALNAPPLGRQGDWYLVTQLQKFKSGVRGANPADASGATMRPMAMTLTDEQAMKNVVAYIQTLAAE